MKRSRFLRTQIIRILKEVKPSRAVKHLLLTITFLCILASTAWSFDNICPYKGQRKAIIGKSLGLPDYAIEAGAVENVVSRYCKDVGKNAYNARGNKFLREVILGPIKGVTWKNSGEIITAPGRASVRRASTSGFYFIIGPGSVADYTFLRFGTEIEGR